VKSIATRLLCLHLLAFFPAAVRVLAQGRSSWMIPGYSSYATITWNGTGFDSSVLVDGTTTGTCPLGCSCGPRHYAMVYNIIGPVGGWVTGPEVAWNSYISVENDQTFDDPQPGQDYSFEAEGEVECTAVGLLASFPFPALPNFGLAGTFTASTTDEPVGGFCPQRNACIGGVQPVCPVSKVWEGNALNCYLYYVTFPPVPYIGSTCLIPLPAAIPGEGPGECTPLVQ